MNFPIDAESRGFRRGFREWRGRCGRSLTVYWGVALTLLGLALDIMPTVMDFMNAPEVTTVINDSLGPHASHALKLIGVVTVLVRLRTLRKAIS